MMSPSTGLASRPTRSRTRAAASSLPQKTRTASCVSKRTQSADDKDAANERFRQFRETGDRRLRNELIEEHRWIAVHCAKRFHHRGVDLDDLIQVAQLGLLKAIERFDPDRGVSITSYAIPTLMGELRRYFRDATWALKVPRRWKDLHVSVGAAIEFLSSHGDHPPTPADIANHLDVSIDDVLEALDAGAAYRTSPYARTNDDDDEGTREATVLRTDDRQLEGCDDAIIADELLSTLPDRERKIVELRYFGELSQSEIAERVGVSQVHVSRLLRSSLAAMHEAAAS